MERIYRMHDLINASRARGECPVTFICGPCDAGKSTISKIILSKDVAAGYTPIFVDLDCGQNSISLPGAISAVVIDRPSSVTEGITIPERVISYEVGDISFPGHVISFATQLTYKLSRTLYSLMTKDEKCTEELVLFSLSIHFAFILVLRSGIVINTCGYVTDNGFTMLKRTIECFFPSVICVAGDEALMETLRSQLRPIPNSLWYFVPAPSSTNVTNINIRIQFTFYSHRLNRNRKLRGGATEPTPLRPILQSVKKPLSRCPQSFL